MSIRVLPTDREAFKAQCFKLWVFRTNFGNGSDIHDQLVGFLCLGLTRIHPDMNDDLGLGKSNVH